MIASIVPSTAHQRRRLFRDHARLFQPVVEWTFDFGATHRDALSVEKMVSGNKRLFPTDDVATEGTTLDCVFRRVREVLPNAEIAAATAGQMIVKAFVKDEKTVCA